MATTEEATPATTSATTEENAKPTAQELSQDEAKLAAVQLSKTDQKTLDKLRELGLYSEEELKRLEVGMRVAKLQAAEAKGERGERETVTIFSPVAANVFRARLLENMSFDDIKNAFGTDLSDTNSKIREVAFKLIFTGLKEGTIGKDWIEAKLTSLNTGKERERKAKDAVVGGTAASNGEAPAAPTAEGGVAEPTTEAEEQNPFESADLTSIEESE